MNPADSLTSPLAWADISLSALEHNLSIIKQVAKGAKIMLVLKANAYGHGSLDIFSVLDVDALAVARTEEAYALRQAGFNGRLLLLSPLLCKETLQAAQDINLDVVLHSESAVELLLNTKFKHPLNVWVKVDTGMHRLGLLPNTAKILIPKILNHEGLNTLSLMSHFAQSEAPTAPLNKKQISTMKELHNGFPDIPVCFANSGGIFFHPEAHFDWVRAGITLYGISPTNKPTQTHLNQLIPAMTLKAKVLDVKTIDVGESVGYGAKWTADKKTNIAVIAIGYGDGYPRHANNGTPILINGKRYPLVGTISMDLTTVDLGSDWVEPGTEATLWGENLPVNEVAEHAETIGYELVTRLSQRVKRFYI